MGQIQVIHCFRDVPRLLWIEQTRLPFAHCAKTTVTRADVASEHEGGRAIAPTLENVWTTCFLADGVQIEPFDQLQHLILISRIAQADTQPFGLGLADLLVVADYTEFAGQLDTSERILRALGRERKRAAVHADYRQIKALFAGL